MVERAKTIQDLLERFVETVDELGEDTDDFIHEHVEPLCAHSLSLVATNKEIDSIEATDALDHVKDAFTAGVEAGFRRWGGENRVFDVYLTPFAHAVGEYWHFWFIGPNEEVVHDNLNRGLSGVMQNLLQRQIAKEPAVINEDTRVSAEWVLKELAEMKFPEQGSAYEYMKKRIQAATRKSENLNSPRVLVNGGGKMKLFRIAAGTNYDTLPRSAFDRGAAPGVTVPGCLKEEKVFELEDLVVDPLNPHRAPSREWMDEAKQGVYGFVDGSSVILVHGKCVQVTL